MIRTAAFLLVLFTCSRGLLASPLEERGTPVMTESAKFTASDGQQSDVFAEQVVVSGNAMIVSARLDDDFGSASGAAYIFRRATASSPWSEATKIYAPVPTPNQWFGTSVALDGDRAAVGAFGMALPAEAYVFERNAGGPEAWGWVGTLSAPEWIGEAVAIDGDRVASSAPGSSSAYLFERNQGGPGNWGLAATLTPEGMGDVERLTSLAIDGDTILLGATTLTVVDDPGAVYVFERDAGTGTWSQTDRLLSSWVPGAAPQGGLVGPMFFGGAVVIEGDTVAVGSTIEQFVGPPAGQGAVYIFGRNQGGPGAWGEVTRLTPSDPEIPKSFGGSLSLDGRDLLVGASSEDSQRGSAYLFSSRTGSWQEIAKLVASDAANLDNFGWGVGLDAGTAAVGSKFDDDLGSASGSVYVFEFGIFADGFESGDLSAWTSVEQ